MLINNLDSIFFNILSKTSPTGMCIEIILLLFSMNVKRETSPAGMSIEINKIL